MKEMNGSEMSRLAWIYSTAFAVEYSNRGFSIFLTSYTLKTPVHEYAMRPSAVTMLQVEVDWISL